MPGRELPSVSDSCSTACGVVVSPSCHHFKINTNTSLDVHSGWLGARIVIRNHAFLVTASSAQRIGVGFSVLVVEAITILKGRLQFTIESGLLPAALEFDSLLAISATNGENFFLSEVGLIIHDVVELLRSNPGSSVIFVPRSIVVSDNQIPG
ncbi:hypothetical protein ACOSQ3_018173 [Xanthoceras sorbifolium]